MRKELDPQRGVSLVELLVGMVILSVVTTMILLGWTSLQASYSSTMKGNEARSIARDAMERLRREIRDVQPLTGQTAITQAGANEIRFTTAFNDPGPNGTGRILLTRYWYTYDGTKSPSQWCISRQRDTNNDGVFTGDPTMVIARNVVNGAVPSAGSPTPVFSYFGTDGVATTDLTKIATVQIRVISDLNPKHSPTYFDLVTTVQPRNLRPL
jgi:prepilin-type N-terminal cleavage/methylation domain-containing protein